MPDKFTETKTVSPKNLKSKFTSACSGVVIGLALFIGSFVVLYNNEGRVDMSTIAKDAVDVDSDKVDSQASGKLVDTTGKLTSSESLGDGLFLKEGKYIALDRKVEIYAWVEEEETETDTNTNTETTTYEYTKQWVETVDDSSEFKYPAEHTNPAKKYENVRKTVSAAQVGVYNIELDQIILPDFRNLSLAEEKVVLSSGAVLANSNYIFISATALTNIDTPSIGDLRISYSILEPDTTVTVFGRLDGSSISTYVDDDNNKLFRIFSGNKDSALKEMHGEYKFALWVFRVIGFVMMWIGLSMMIAPVLVFTDVIPIVGKMSRAVVGAATFVIALILTFATVAISAILHNTLLLIVTAAVVVGIIAVVAFVMMKRK